MNWTNQLVKTMRDRHFMEDENELPYLVSSKRDNYKSNSYGRTNSAKLYETAQQLMDENKLDEALELINILIDRNPEDDRYWNLKGIIYSDYGNRTIVGDRQYDESIKCFNIAIKLNPNDSTLKNNKALTLIDYANDLHNQSEYVSAIGKIDEALSLFDKNKINNHTLANVWNLKGLCYHAMGSRDAFDCYDKALEYEPDNETIKHNKDSLRHYQGIDNLYFYG